MKDYFKHLKRLIKLNRKPLLLWYVGSVLILCLTLVPVTWLLMGIKILGTLMLIIPVIIFLYMAYHDKKQLKRWLNK